MPKQKTHSGAKKRFKVTGTGKIMREQANRRHLLEVKSSKRTRRLAADLEVAPARPKAGQENAWSLNHRTEKTFTTRVHINSFQLTNIQEKLWHA